MSTQLPTGSYADGRWANAEDRERVRHIAVFTTVFAGPVAWLAITMRKRNE